MYNMLLNCFFFVRKVLLSVYRSTQDSYPLLLRISLPFPLLLLISLSAYHISLFFLSLSLICVYFLLRINGRFRPCSVYDLGTFDFKTTFKDYS